MAALLRRRHVRIIARYIHPAIVQRRPPFHPQIFGCTVETPGGRLRETRRVQKKPAGAKKHRGRKKKTPSGRMKKERRACGREPEQRKWFEEVPSFARYYLEQACVATLQSFNPRLIRIIAPMIIFSFSIQQFTRPQAVRFGAEQINTHKLWYRYLLSGQNLHAHCEFPLERIVYWSACCPAFTVADGTTLRFQAEPPQSAEQSVAR